ncbi:MAG: c-type cytochrome [Deltaproteobacteria bacterium]|nr:c-type cytochrome [Deltaproteobacteria bacterium]
MYEWNAVRGDCSQDATRALAIESHTSCYLVYLWTVIGLSVAFLLRPAVANGFPWSTDMFRGQFVRPLERTPRNQPVGTLSENELEPMSREQAASTLHNPLTRNQTTIAHGRALFSIDCVPCHGTNGAGIGPARPVLMVRPADLRAGRPAEVSDGYIFSTIRDGGIAMPSYGDTLSVNDTWEVVLYVRYLQHEYAARARDP